MPAFARLLLGPCAGGELETALELADGDETPAPAPDDAQLRQGPERRLERELWGPPGGSATSCAYAGPIQAEQVSAGPTALTFTNNRLG